MVRKNRLLGSVFESLHGVSSLIGLIEGLPDESPVRSAQKYTAQLGSLVSFVSQLGRLNWKKLIWRGAVDSGIRHRNAQVF